MTEEIKDNVENAEATETKEAVVPCCDGLYKDALKLVNKWSLYSAGAGLIPIPLVDTVAIAGIQLVMLKKLSEHYGIAFNEQRCKSAIAALLGGVHAGLVSSSALKFSPILGVISLVTLPAASGAITYAVGRVFVQHFAYGGTFLDFNPEKVKCYFEATLKSKQ